MKNTRKLLTMNTAVLLAASLLFFNSCKDKDDDNPPASSNDATVWVLNEGGYNKGNASLDTYNPKNGEVAADAFSKKNNRPLGDVLQSATRIGDNVYLVVNNSGKIEIVDRNTFESKGQITGLGQPRFMLKVSDNKAYVTNFSNEITIINLSSNTKSGSIVVPGLNEGITMAGDKVFTTNFFHRKVYVINPATDALADSIILTGTANGVITDANKKLWILVDSSGASGAKFMRINPTSFAVEESLSFPAGKSAIKATISGDGKKIYYLSGDGLFSFDITAASLPTTPVKSGYFYGLGVDPSEGSVYISDALDFNQKGVVYRFKPSGDTLSFKAGIIPGGFFFNY